MEILCHNNYCPEMECISLLEQRFDTRPTAVNSVEALASRLTERYNIPGFELEPLLNPLAELERTVNGGLTVSEDKLKFYFTIRDKGQSSLAGFLLPELKSQQQFQGLTEEDRSALIRRVLRRILDVPEAEFPVFPTLNHLMEYLRRNKHAEDVKWICATLYCAVEEYLEELNGILRMAVALFQEHLPDLSQQYRQTARYAREKLQNDFSSLFPGMEPEKTLKRITVYPSIMGFDGVSWNLETNDLYFGIYYQTILTLIEKYSDQSSLLICKLKAVSDKSRLEILHCLKAGALNGLEIANHVGLSPATVSRHANQLRNEGFLSTTKSGTSVFYNLDREKIQNFFRELEHYLL
ncbi:MAG: ArsR/SmtB family transcription factor [Oscillospiraceae bacterium]|jgi:biotin operon repressor|nr:winged helix-turn-helix transcriptional regulator [Bacillota bacterium]